MTQKIGIWASSHNFVGLYLRNEGTYRQSEINLLSSDMSSTCPHNGELRPTNGRDLLASLGHPCKFQRVSRLGSVTAPHLVVGVSQTAAFNRGRHLYSTGRPSRWALAHISSDDYALFVFVGRCQYKCRQLSTGTFTANVTINVYK